MIIHAETIAIIGAMQEEIAYLKSQLNDIKTHQFGEHFTIYTGKIHQKNIVLSLSGIGKVNAAIATTLVIQHFQPDCVINTGSAGGIGKGIRVGDVVIGQEAAHHDVDATVFGYESGQVPQLPTRFLADKQLIQAALEASQVFQAAQVYQGLIVSGDCFVHHQEHIERIKTHFADAQAVEMEAAAIAQTCALLNTPFVIIRAISDSAEEKANISFEEFLPIAAKHSAQMVLNLIAHQ